MPTQTFNPTIGPDRASLEDRDRDYIEEIERQGTLVVDARRSRSSYFDGRFLAARDLIREQSYFLTRQADLSRAGGAGVIRGLDVRAVGNRLLRIGSGHGVTFAGELVALDQPVTVGVEDVAELQQLDASFGLAPVPTTNPEARTGLYVLVLRPIEYVTREIVKYPTATDGKRSTEPGDIVEGVALTLVPYRDDRGERDPWKQRSHVARTMFLDRASRGMPAETLPLAMLSLEKGFIRWLDVWMVRREIGSEHSGVVGFGVTPRALREAHLAQYDRQLLELVADRQSKGALRFAASDYFEVLPPAGRMPAAAIDGKDFTQHWFPAQMTVDLTIVTDDEVTMLVEESLLLPPVDVSGEFEDLDFTTMQILIPMSRASLRQLRLETAPRPLRLIPPLLARRKPIDVLHTLTRRNVVPSAMVDVDPRSALEAAWREALAAVSDHMLWFVRRRTLELRVPELFPAPQQSVVEVIERGIADIPAVQPPVAGTGRLPPAGGANVVPKVFEVPIEKVPESFQPAIDALRDPRVSDPLVLEVVTGTTPVVTAPSGVVSGGAVLEPVVSGDRALLLERLAAAPTAATETTVTREVLSGALTGSTIFIEPEERSPSPAELLALGREVPQ